MSTHVQHNDHRTLTTRATLRLRAVLALLLWGWLLTPAVLGQCADSLQSGGPIATLRGRVFTTLLWDPDGSGPLPQLLVAGGQALTGGDQATPVGLLVYDGVQWRGLGFDLNEPVYALADFNGDLIAGGDFTLPTAGGPANKIARWDGAAWQPLGNSLPGLASNRVHTLAVFQGLLYVGGTFSIVLAPGSAAFDLMKWDGANWTSGGLPVGSSTSVLALQVFGGNLYAGGSFQSGGSSGPRGLARWDGLNWIAAGNPNGTVTSLRAVHGTTHANSFLLAAGAFTSIGGVGANHVARAGLGANTWSAMGAGLPQLADPELLTRSLFLGGVEVIAAGTTTNNAARVWRWNGTAWTALGSVGPTSGTAAASAPVYYGGYVVGIDSNSTPLRSPSMFRFASDWVPLSNKGITAPVQCLAFDGQDLIAGGAFLTIDGIATNGIARRTGTGIGASWSALGAGMTGGGATVQAVVRASNGDVFAGGSFTSAGGIAANNIARWNGSAWAPLGTGTNGTVRALLLTASGDLIAGGDFSNAGGVACNRIARWNGTAWSQLTSGMDNPVRCLAALPNGDLVAGGTFVFAGGVTCNRIARWNGANWSAMNSGMDAAVHALGIRPNGELVAGGAFTIAGGTPSARLARWNGSTWAPLGVGAPGTVDALTTLPDGDVLAGGPFFTGTLNHLVRWNGFDDSIASVDAGLDGASVLAFATAPNGDVYLGGDFDAIRPSRAAGYLAILTTNCPALASPVATACVGPGGPVTLVADSLPWLGSTFRATASGFSSQALAVSVLGLAPANLPLSQLFPMGLPNCDLLASTEAALLTVPVAGTSHYQLALPDLATFAGLPFSHQFLQLDVAGTGAILSVSSSNALSLVLGRL